MTLLRIGPDALRSKFPGGADGGSADMAAAPAAKIAVASPSNAADNDLDSELAARGQRDDGQDTLIGALQNLTGDLHAPPVSTGWAAATGTSQGGVVLTDGADFTLAALRAVPDARWTLFATRSVGNLDTGADAAVRIPAGADPRQYRVRQISSLGDHVDYGLNQAFAHLGNSTDDAWSYWEIATPTGRLGSITTRIELWVTGSAAHIGQSTYGGDVTGEVGGITVAALLSRLLPPLPAEGARDGRSPKFRGNALEWLETLADTDDIDVVQTLPETRVAGPGKVLLQLSDQTFYRSTVDNEAGRVTGVSASVSGDIRGTTSQAGTWTHNPNDILNQIYAEDNVLGAVFRASDLETAKGSALDGTEQVVVEITIGSDTDAVTCSLATDDDATTVIHGVEYLLYEGIYTVNDAATDVNLATNAAGTAFSVVIKYAGNNIWTHSADENGWTPVYPRGAPRAPVGLAGLAADAIRRLVPPFPDAGSRTRRVPQFAGDTLGWGLPTDGAHNYATLPDVGDFEDGDVVVARGAPYERTTASVIEGRIGETGTDVSTSVYHGGWQHNPNSAIFGMDIVGRNLRLEVLRETFETAKGSAAAVGDQLSVTISHGSPATQQTVVITLNTTVTITGDPGHHYLVFTGDASATLTLGTVGANLSGFDYPFTLAIRLVSPNVPLLALGTAAWTRTNFANTGFAQLKQTIGDLRRGVTGEEASITDRLGTLEGRVDTLEDYAGPGERVLATNTVATWSASQRGVNFPAAASKRLRDGFYDGSFRTLGVRVTQAAATNDDTALWMAGVDIPLGTGDALDATKVIDFAANCVTPQRNAFQVTGRMSTAAFSGGSWFGINLHDYNSNGVSNVTIELIGIP